MRMEIEKTEKQHFNTLLRHYIIKLIFSSILFYVMLCYVINKMSLLIMIALFCFKLTFHFMFFFCYIKLLNKRFKQQQKVKITSRSIFYIL